MSRQEHPNATTQREEAVRALDGLRELNRQLRAQGDQLAGHRPRPELRVIQGGKRA